MLGLNFTTNLHRQKSLEQISRCITSFIFGIFTQLALLIIPHSFGSFPLILQLLLSAVVLVLAIVVGQSLRRLIGARASAPAFVLFHVFFVWLVYVCVIRRAASVVMDIVFNGELVVLVIGFFRMLASDPGFVRADCTDVTEVSTSQDGAHLEEVSLSEMETAKCLQRSTDESPLPSRRVRYCRSCKAYVMGFDHHCPAFGNCIGDKNYGLFIMLLVGFILAEALYSVLSYQWIDGNVLSRGSKTKISQSLAATTLLFCLFQVVWQVVFLTWHLYCACSNIRTDEWINWRKYPEFHVIFQPLTGQSSPGVKFRNPYHKGLLQNLKETLLT